MIISPKSLGPWFADAVFVKISPELYKKSCPSDLQKSLANNLYKTKSFFRAKQCIFNSYRSYLILFLLLIMRLVIC